METNESDEELVHRYRQLREEPAFKTLMERYQVRVYQLVAAVLGNAHREEWSDVVQDIFVRVYRGLPTFRADARFSTWLYRVTYNHSLNYKVRSRRRHMYVTLSSVENLATTDSMSSAKLEQQQRFDLLNSAIDRLPNEYQTVVRLYYWQQLPIHEIAMLLTSRENTIKSYLHRARKLLAVHLKGERDTL